MRVAIIEDEATAVRGLTSILLDIVPDVEIVAVHHDVAGSIEFFQQHPLVDVVFMDIHLADGLSFEIFKQVDVSAPIVFCTAYDEYALEAFQVNSVSYLLKPINGEELAAALQKINTLSTTKLGMQQVNKLLEVLGSEKKFKTSFVAKAGRKIFSIPTKSIAAVRVDHKITYLHTFESKTFQVDYSLEEICQLLDPALFFRINRQVVIAFESIDHLEIDHGQHLAHLKIEMDATPISRNRLSGLKIWLDR